MDEQVFQALVEEFYLESRERLDRIQEVLLGLEELAPEPRRERLVEARRELHTLKGNSGMMGLGELQELAHRIEDQVVAAQERGEGLREVLAGVDRFRTLLEQACRGAAPAGDAAADAQAGDEAAAPGAVQESVRVSFASLDALVDLLSEMVIFRNRLGEFLGQGLAGLDKAQRQSPVWREVESAHRTLGRVLADIQGGVTRLRMVPLGSLFAQLKRIVYDEGEAEGRQVQLVTSGGDTPLDRGLLEVASEAMGHLVRNAVVHGLESPAERRRLGKPAAGRITVTAAARAEEVVIDISDDGRGVDRQELLAAARLRGFELPQDVDLQALLSLPGVSTRERADRSAGRGMGMSAVMASVRRLGGKVEVVSAPGRGTRLRLRLPLTAAIVRALLVGVDDELFAVPLSAVEETIRFADERRHSMNHAEVFEWRGGLVPLLDLGMVFGERQAPRRQGYAVVVEAEGKYRALLVDEIAGIRDVVVKPLDEVTGRGAGLAGATILGDGRVILIVDPIGLILLSPLTEQTV
ncbi:MAG TPA: chemotaxis protein CheW [Thermoanaerobaculia bacterium]|nr:chemotaxis protein CheW [Thermoanaerobaculia bacterium]